MYVHVHGISLAHFPFFNDVIKLLNNSRTTCTCTLHHNNNKNKRRQSSSGKRSRQKNCIMHKARRWEKKKNNKYKKKNKKTKSMKNTIEITDCPVSSFSYIYMYIHELVRYIKLKFHVKLQRKVFLKQFDCSRVLCGNLF